MQYHDNLPEKWIEIIEKDEVLSSIWEEHNSESEEVPEFLFQAVRGDMERMKPIFALYGGSGLEMYDKLVEIDALTADNAVQIAENGEKLYAGYFWVKGSEDNDAAIEIVKDYIKAMNNLYVNEFEQEALIDEDARILFPPVEEYDKINKKLLSGYDAPEYDMYDAIGDWFDMELGMKDECEELKDLLWEALYHISNDYNLSYYILWSISDRSNSENPFLPYYKLWCMGLNARFMKKDEIVVLRN